jgi:hypothetical protein
VGLPPYLMRWGSRDYVRPPTALKVGIVTHKRPVCRGEEPKEKSCVFGIGPQSSIKEFYLVEFRAMAFLVLRSQNHAEKAKPCCPD